MPSWSRDLFDDRPGYFWQAHDEDQRRIVELERRESVGNHALYGFPRPVHPACPDHGYGMVENRCGVCLLEEQQRTERRAA